MDFRKIFIVNPTARRCPRDVGRRIEAVFPEAVVLFTERAGDAGRLACMALTMVRSQEDTVVACGGDGTVREVAEAVGEEATLGILPLGTVNQVAGQLGIPGGLKGALGVLEAGSIARVYPGRCFLDGSGEPHMFFIGVSAGPDADAVELVDPLLKRAIGGGAYAAAFLRRLMRPVAPNALCLLEDRGRVERFLASEVIALAGELYAGRFVFSREASLRAPGLVLAAVDGGRLEVLMFFLRALIPARSRPCHPEVVEGSITIELPHPSTFQIDGDRFTARCAVARPMSTPLHFRVPAAL